MEIIIDLLFSISVLPCEIKKNIMSVFCCKLLSTILENSLFCASTLGGGMVHVLIKTVISTAAISVSNVTIKVTPSHHLVLGRKKQTDFQNGG